VLLVHLMTAGRLKYLQAGREGPKTPAFRLAFQGGGQLVLTEAGAKKRAGVWLLRPEEAEAELEHLGPEALGLRAGRLGGVLGGEPPGGGGRKRAGVWLLRPEEAEAELEHLGPEALGLGAGRLGEILAEQPRRLH